MATVSAASASTSSFSKDERRAKSVASSNRSSVNSGLGLGLSLRVNGGGISPSPAHSPYFENDDSQAFATPSSHSPPTSLDTPRAPALFESERKDTGGRHTERFPTRAARADSERGAKRAVDSEDLATAVALQSSSTASARRQTAATFGTSARLQRKTSTLALEDSIRSRNDFRAALGRRWPTHPTPTQSSTVERPSGRAKSTREKDLGDIVALLEEARHLSKVGGTRRHAATGTATPPMEAVKRAIKDPHNTGRQHRAGNFTSASTPEGAIGRIALPPLTLHDDELSLSQSMFDALDIINGEPLLASIPAEPFEQDTRVTAAEADVEALRSGLRFVLSCYDDLDRRAKENRGVTDAIITSIVTEGQKLKAGNNGVDGKIAKVGQTSHPTHQRMRTGSILKALGRGKPNAALSGVKGGYGVWGSGVKSPARATQMDFDASPEHLVGPSNRLGMASLKNSWQSPLSLDQRSQTRSPEAGPRTRSLSNANSVSSSKMAAIGDAQELQKRLTQVEGEKQRLMSEMESLSEELFLQANEMVKQERIRSSALEKELDNLKAAMSATKEGSVASQTIRLSASKLSTDCSNIELEAQTDKEGLMMTAVAQASRECAEAEEEAVEWRAHCEELQTRLEILEEALYNSMSILAEHETLKDGVEADAFDSRPASTDLATEVRQHWDYAESDSSFYSADEADINRATDGVSSAMASTDRLAPDKSFNSSTSDASLSRASAAGRKLSMISGSSERPISFATEEGSIDSAYSHPSSYSARVCATSPRGSVVSSRRQSRQLQLPPRLPEPVSPLPNIPNAGAINEQKSPKPAQRRRSSVAVVTGRSRADSVGESRLRFSSTQEVKESKMRSGTTAMNMHSSISSPDVLTPSPMNHPSAYLDQNLSPKDTSGSFITGNRASKAALALTQEEPNGNSLFSSSFAIDNHQWDDKRRQADAALLDAPTSASHASTPANGKSGMNRRHSLAHSTTSRESRTSSSGSMGANVSQLSRKGSTTRKGLRMFGVGGNRDSGSPYIPVKNVGRKMSTPSSSSVHQGATEVPRRQSAGNAVASPGRPRKSAKSAILGHMPPTIPQARSVASIASESVDGGSFDSDSQRSIKQPQHSPTDESSLRSASHHASPAPESKSFGRRRRFNDVATNAEMDADYPVQY